MFVAKRDKRKKANKNKKKVNSDKESGIVRVNGKEYIPLETPPIPPRPIDPLRNGPREKPSSYVPDVKQIKPLPGFLFPGDSDSPGSVSGSLFPHRKNATLKYADVFSMLSSGLTVYTYRLNSLYDPDETGAGNQPVGFDQLMALYKYYRVTKAKVTVFLTNSGTSAYYAIVPSGSATDPGGYQSASCWPGTKFGILGPSTGETNTKITMEIDIKKFFGYHNDNWDMDLTGTASSNPAQMLYIHLCTQEFDSTAKAIDGLVNIEFISEFTNLLPLAVS